MSSIYGRNFKISIFGESHGVGIGVVIDGCPAGIPLDLDRIANEMARRRPGQGKHATLRSEADRVEILSGFYNGKTTGTPLTGIIRNTDAHSVDYAELNIIPRPSHGDFSGSVRYGGHQDYRGGGHFSARLTAPLVFAGAVAQQYLDLMGISVGSHILTVADVRDLSFDPIQTSKEQLQHLRDMQIPVNDNSCVAEMLDAIEEARVSLNSVGGVVETIVTGMPVGIGSPLFENVEARLSHMIFSIPAVKGLEFGTGFAITKMHGSEANDPFEMKDGKVVTKSNHNGGINGGITNGMPILFRTAFKPTASIYTEQDTVNLKLMENAKLTIKGRHDPCIVPRAVPVVDAATAIVMVDLLLDARPVVKQVEETI